MRGKIIRCIDPKSMEKTKICAICGSVDRRNKSPFEVELACGYKCELVLCRPCTGAEESNMRKGTSIEIPYLLDHHYHVESDKGRTFWDYANILAWIKEFVFAAEGKDDGTGHFTVTLPVSEVKFFKCYGKAPSVVT